MRMAILAAVICLAGAGAPAGGSEPRAEAALFPRQVDLMSDTPEVFPRFYFAGHDTEAQLLSRYMWYHFSNRLGNGKTLFNKEYLAVADLWAGGAVDKHRKKPIQEVHREDILAMQMDSEGYVHTHQHFSHAHEHGWPFPMWPQAGTGPHDVNGKTAGWHFQEKGPGWVWDMFLQHWNTPQYEGETAANSWKLENVKSLGIAESKWQLEATGESPTITSPEGIEIEAFQAPFLQLRWTRTGEPASHALPYIEWMCEGDRTFGADRRVYFAYEHADAVGSENTVSGATGVRHCMIAMHRHPKWTGQIKRMRISLAPGESDVKFAIDSFFTAYDTRHTINNPIFILASWELFRWTGDLDFLRTNINRMRTALRYQQNEMGGLKYNHIRNTWPGHDGRRGYVVNADGSKTVLGGRGIGNNYWDLLPFGWDDMYSTSQYYAATLVMAEIEEAVRANPGWDMPLGALALDPDALRKHAAAVKTEAGRKFWDSKKGRFIGWIDSEGSRCDYGFTFMNLDAIWYGIPSGEQAKRIMDWIDGRRIVAGDTSTGADIYRWRFGPRATTLRNVEWYGQGWYNPEHIPWGGQIQDGGAVLGFAFYDLWARLKVYGPDDTWNRLVEILKWEKEVMDGGGYREYYKDGKPGTTLQGGGTAGGIGVDCEFFESSLIPAIVTRGFLGIEPGAADLAIRPKLPDQCPEMGVSNVLYRGVRLDIRAGLNSVTVNVKDRPANPIRLALDGDYKLRETGRTGSSFELARPGVYSFER